MILNSKLTPLLMPHEGIIKLGKFAGELITLFFLSPKSIVQVIELLSNQMVAVYVIIQSIFTTLGKMIAILFVLMILFKLIINVNPVSNYSVNGAENVIMSVVVNARITSNLL